MHKKLKSYFRKSTAVLTAAALTLSAGTAMVFGASTYQEEEKKALSKLMETLPKRYENLTDEYKAFGKGIRTNLSIRLEDQGRTMLDLLTPLNLSWLNNMEMETQMLFKDGVEGVDINLMLNDTKICNLQTYADFGNRVNLTKMPELFDGYLKADMNGGTYNEDDDLSSEYTEIYYEQLQQYMDFIMNIGEYMPQVSTVDTLLNRYGNLIIDHVSDTSSTEEVLTLEDISQNCTVYEGTLHQDELYTLAENILTTAKEDNELKELLTAWEKTIPDAENLYQDFLKGIEDSLTDLKSSEDTPDDEAYLSSKIWVSEDDVIVGRQFSLTDSTGTDPIITWMMPQQNGNYEYLLDFYTEGSQLALAGYGNITDNSMLGTYFLYSDTQPIMCIEMENYDLAASKEGYSNINYIITPLPGIADEETYNVLSNFSIIAQLESEKHNSSMLLTLLNADTVLGSIKVSVSAGSSIVIPEITASDKVYDTSSAEDETAFAETLSFDKITENMKQAGVPEELVSQLETALEESLSASKGEYLDEDSMED